MTYSKAFLRALEWRIVAMIIDFTVAYLLTGQIIFSLGLSGTSNIVRTIAHTIFIKHRGH
jgi:uncharacterized membrane protein